MNPQNLDRFFGRFLLWLCGVVVGIGIGSWGTRTDFERQAAKRGFAAYTVGQNTGKVEWKWKEEVK